MSISRWVFAVALGLALISAVVWGIYATGLKLGETKAQNTYHASRYAAHAADQINGSCLNGDVADVAKCIAEVIDSTNENQRAQKDLQAQTEMALWAFWMLISTVVMAAITLLGVVFVWQTFKVTRDMAIDTRDIGKAQVRAYLGYGSTTISISDSTVSLQATLKNFGASPANEVFGWFALVLVQDPEGLDPQEAERRSEKFSTDLQAGGEFSINNSVTVPISAIERWKRGEIEAFIFAGARYRTVFKSLGTRKITTKKKVVWVDEAGQASVRPTEGYDQAD